MGGCGSGDNSARFGYQFGEDDQQSDINHVDGIQTSNSEVKIYLKNCQDRLKQSSKMYKDPTLKSEPIILKQSNTLAQLKCIFNRPYHFLKKQSRNTPYSIFPSNPGNSSDIFIVDEALQYFGVFLCFLADHIQLVQNIILTEPNTYGIHAISMYIQGRRKPIFIDDYILCYEQKPLFSQPIKQNGMWPCLLEKAWLKVKDYESKMIQITSPTVVFQHFLPYPIGAYNISLVEQDTFEEIKKKIVDLNQSKSGIIVTSKKQPLHKIGISGRKYFYLKTLFKHQGKFLFYFRNPCGAFDFRGSHRIISKELEQKIKKQAQQDLLEQGNFILEEEEFIEQIEELIILHYNKNSNIVSELSPKIDLEQQCFVEITVKQPEEISISFVQEEMKGDIPFYPVTYHILKDQNENCKLISGNQNTQGCFGVRSTSLIENVYQKLEPGNYLIRLKKKMPHGRAHSQQQQRHILWGQAQQIKKYQCNDRIVITASSQIQIKPSFNDSYKRRFEELLKILTQSQMFRGSRYIGPDIEYYIVRLGDLVYLLIKKKKRFTSYNLQVNFQGKINLRCISHSLGLKYTGIPFIQADVLIIFEKVDLREKTDLGRYFIQAF